MPPVRRGNRSSNVNSAFHLSPPRSAMSSPPKAQLENKENWTSQQTTGAETKDTDDQHTQADGGLDESFGDASVISQSPAKHPGQGSYDALKSFNGQVYKGMAVGGSHVWNYQPGVWKETKEEPDLWKIDFETVKKRAKNAPTGSGAPVGTEYHWLIVAHQYVKKTDANTYETHLVGSKYKLAHKNSTANSWSIPSVKSQRDREIELLDDAKRRVQGLPPVLATEKVKVVKKEKGQQKLDSLFSKPIDQATPTKKRKRSFTQ